jgi:cytochrome c peroxidase
MVGGFDRPAVNALALCLLPIAAAALGAGVPSAGGPTQEPPATHQPRVTLTVADIPADKLPSELPRELPRGLERFAAAPWRSAEIEALGRKLFFDPILSGDRSLACASCHRPDHGFAEPRAKSIGIRGQDVGRNAPSLLNHALSQRVLWDGRAESLEQQVLLVIEAEKEMDLRLADAVQRLTEQSEYAARFQSAFDGPPTQERIAEAIAAFVRRLTMGDSPVDRFRAGDVTALDSNEENGMWLFEGRGRCWKCHVGPSFADESFHNTGIGAALTDGAEVATPEPGRAAITTDDADRGKFRTPGLRGVALTPPYMHDGSLATLEEVVEFYRKGARPNSHLSPHIGPIEMSDEEARNLVAFLKALSR